MIGDASEQADYAWLTEAQCSTSGPSVNHNVKLELLICCTGAHEQHRSMYERCVAASEVHCVL